MDTINDVIFQILSHGTVSLSNRPDTITSLNLANNQIEELPATLLSDQLPHLQSLDLSNNTILDVKNIQSIVLSKELLYFKISYNPIRNLGYTTDNVLYSQSISHLDVSYCAIASIINPASFMYMLNLTYLDLSGNPLLVVDHIISSTLISLDLSNCLLGDKGIREESFKSVPNLLNLNLSMNSQFTRFPLTIPISLSVVNLDASYCAFEKVDLNSFPNLQHAILKGNIIKTLHNNMLSNNLQLQSLDISENSVHSIETNAFVGNISLEKLDLSFNLLSHLNWEVFSQSLKLTDLNVSRNLFTALEEVPIPSLITLDASRCEIFKLSPRLLAKAQHLKYLNLSHNAVEKVPRRLTSKKLVCLDLSYCRISDLQFETFKDLTSLTSLNLIGNRLTIPLRSSFFEQFVNLKELHLTNNPWHCDCNDLDLRKLWKYSISSQVKADYLQYLICNSPKEYSGISLEKSCFENLTADAHIASKSGAWFSFLIPFLTLCCLLAIVIVIRQAYAHHALEIQERETENQRSNGNAQSRQFSPRVPVHFFDDDLERGIQMSVNDSTQGSSIIRELTKLPSYEEALLLPKPHSSEGLQNIVKSYEENGRFERSISENVQPNSSVPINPTGISHGNPSTSTEL